jgi:hypothetical protein
MVGQKVRRVRERSGICAPREVARVAVFRRIPPYSDVFRCPFSPRRRLQCFPSTTVALTSGIRHPNAAGSALAAVPASLHHRERW